MQFKQANFAIKYLNQRRVQKDLLTAVNPLHPQLANHHYCFIGFGRIYVYAWKIIHKTTEAVYVFYGSH